MEGKKISRGTDAFEKAFELKPGFYAKPMKYCPGQGSHEKRRRNDIMFYQ
jgi:hypothetical protein